MAFKAGVNYSLDYTYLRIEGNIHLLRSRSGDAWYLSLVPTTREPISVIVVAVVRINTATVAPQWTVEDWRFFQPEPCEWDDLNSDQKIAVIGAYQGWISWSDTHPLPWADEPELVTLAVLGAL